VRERSREPDVERDRDLDRDGTDADDGERDRLRLRLLLGGVRESDRDLDRLGDRLDFLLRADSGVVVAVVVMVTDGRGPVLLDELLETLFWLRLGPKSGLSGRSSM